MGKEDYKNEKKGHGFLCVPKELLFDNRINMKQPRSMVHQKFSSFGILQYHILKL